VTRLFLSGLLILMLSAFEKRPFEFRHNYGCYMIRIGRYWLIIAEPSGAWDPFMNVMWTGIELGRIRAGKYQIVRRWQYKRVEIW